MDLGSTIRELRKKQNMKQSELAEKAGISRVAIGNYERNDRNPNIEILLKIANALKVPVMDLIDVDDYEKISLISKKTHTHPAYIMGETNEPHFEKYLLDSMIKDLNFDKLKESVNIYPDDFKNLIFLLWGNYLSNMISDWYSEDENVSAEDLDKIYFLNTLCDLYVNFRGHINYLIENNDIKEDKIDFYSIELIYKAKTKLLNDISNLIDTTISRTFLNKDENKLIYDLEIINKYRNIE